MTDQPPTTRIRLTDAELDQLHDAAIAAVPNAAIAHAVADDLVPAVEEIITARLGAGS